MTTSFRRAVVDHQTTWDERFTAPELDFDRWIPYYLPQWAGRERSRARYRLTGESLELFIADDQPPWCPEIEPKLRVSSLQTGCLAGPVGSTIGQHRTDERMTVVEPQPTKRLVTPTYGAVEMRARWTPHPDHMVALWMIGFEDRPDRSAEICVCEIFGSEATTTSALVGTGVHPFADPAIADEFDKIEVAIDVSELHEYAAVWTPHDVTFYIDGRSTKVVDQSPAYPMQIMLGIYDLGHDTSPAPAEPFVVDRIRVLQALHTAAPGEPEPPM